jgi:hypothetical protein
MGTELSPARLMHLQRPSPHSGSHPNQRLPSSSTARRRASGRPHRSTSMAGPTFLQIRCSKAAATWCSAMSMARIACG